MSLSPLRCLCSSTPLYYPRLVSLHYNAEEVRRMDSFHHILSLRLQLFAVLLVRPFSSPLIFFFIFKKHSAAELVHQAFTAQFSYIPSVGLTRCNAFPFGQLFKGEVLQKCGEQRRTSNNEKCHFDLNQKHEPHLSRSTISNDFSDGLSPVSPCMLSAANQENLLKMQNMVCANPLE